MVEEASAAKDWASAAASQWHGVYRAQLPSTKASYAVKVMEISIETEDAVNPKETNAYKTMEQEVNVLRACINCIQIVQVLGVEVITVGNQPARLNVVGGVPKTPWSDAELAQCLVFAGAGRSCGYGNRPSESLRVESTLAVWNQNECAEHVIEALNMFLVAFDVDFATVIELADPTYQSPSGYEFLVSQCGHDLVYLSRGNASGESVTRATDLTSSRLTGPGN
eukprot:s2473_g7.t1